MKRVFLFFWGLFTKLLLLSLLGAGLASAIWGPQELIRMAKGEEKKKDTSLDEVTYYKVKKGELQIGLTERGSLRATKTVSIFVNTRRSLKFTWVETEGKLVKEGDVIARFETQDFKDRIVEFEKNLAEQMENLEVAKKDVGISRSTGILSLAQAETKLKDTRDDLKKFKQLEAPRKLKELRDKKRKARRDIDNAKQALAEKREVVDGQLYNGEDGRKKALDDVEMAKEKLKEMEKALDNATIDQKLYRTYDYKKSVRNKLEAVENAKLALKKAQVSAKNYLAQKKSQVRKIEDNIKRTQKNIKEFKEIIEKCEVKAPVGGRILYGIPGRRWPRKEDIAVGKTAWDGYTFMSIPDESAFVIDTFIAEEYRHRIKVEDPVRITVEAVPDLQIDGKIQTIDGFAKSRNGGPKSYKTQISMSGTDPRMVSGMSVTVEIVAETIKEALLVPIEAVFNVDDETVCYVRTAEGNERRVVKTGKSNDHFVEILEGLQEGDEVSLTEELNTTEAEESSEESSEKSGTKEASNTPQKKNDTEKK